MTKVRIEDVKSAGLAIDIDLLARTGFESISEEDRYRLKTQGVCAQRQVGVFMLRIRVPGGKATAGQLRRVADLADAYGHKSLHVTTRSGLELHHVAIANVPAIWAALAEVGLTTKGSCGDTVRNVVACSHAGTYPGEVLPPAPFVRLLHDRIVETSDGTNISRKMNPAFACSPDCDDHVATSDVGFVATPDPAGGPPTFTVWGAGGLGATPRLAIELRRGLPQAELLPAFDAVVALGRKYGDRGNRAKAKIKLLVDNLGLERVRALFADEFAAAKAAGPHAALHFDHASTLNENYHTGDSHDRVATAHRTHGDNVFAIGSVRRATARRNGAHGGGTRRPRAATEDGAVAQRQAGLFTLPALIPMGEIASDTARALAAVAERYGDGIVHLTPDQNAEIQAIREADLAAARDTLERMGLRTTGRGAIGDVVSCVGLDYCPLAVAHAMTMGEAIALEFDRLADNPRYTDFRIHVSGCPHSCARHQIADIGLAGAITGDNGERVEAYVLFLGGNAHARRLGTTFPTKIPRRFVVPVIRALIAVYEEIAAPDEGFSATVARVGTDAFFAVIAQTLEGTRIARPAVRAVRVVVIGDGIAGARFVAELRSRASEPFEVSVLSDEPHPRAPSGVRRVDSRGGARALRIDRIARTVICADGTTHAYDALVIAAGGRPSVPRGIVPNIEVARNAGIESKRGIIVNDDLRTSDPRIFAIGECAQHRGVTNGPGQSLAEQCAIVAERLASREMLRSYADERNQANRLQ